MKIKKIFSLLLIIIFLCQGAGFCAQEGSSALRPALQGSLAKEAIDVQKMNLFKSQIKQLMGEFILHMLRSSMTAMYFNRDFIKVKSKSLLAEWKKSQGKTLEDLHEESQGKLVDWYENIDLSLDYERLFDLKSVFSEEKMQELRDLAKTFISEARKLCRGSEEEDIINNMEVGINENIKAFSDFIDSTQVLFSTNDINDIVKIFCKNVLPEPIAKHVKLFLFQKELFFDKASEEEPLIIVGIIYNLIDNALRVSENKADVTVETFRDGNRIKIQASDTGPGIPEKDLEKICNKDFTTKPDGKGGMGLYLTLEYLKLKHGRIQVDSKTESEGAWRLTFDDSWKPRQISPSDRTERGTTFTIWLPLAQKREEETELASMETVIGDYSAVRTKL